MSSQFGGWTGKTLRVDLTTGAITTVDTVAKYKDYLGGTGLGYKVLWDEVPPGTKAFDPTNRIIFATGPITATGAPSAGRLSITAVLPYADINDLPGAGHMGGHFGPEFKYAGWDAIIVQGAAASPVWLQIVDSKVTIMDATQMWGNGTPPPPTRSAPSWAPQPRWPPSARSGNSSAACPASSTTAATAQEQV